MGMTRHTRPDRSADRSPFRFVPGLTRLEDRTVPATFYVDPSLAGAADGDTVTFDAGDPGQLGGLRYASTAAFFAADTGANPNATYAFSDLRQAIDASEINAGPDTIRIAREPTPISLDNSAVTTTISEGAINSITITQPLSLIGAGVGETVVMPTANTLFDDGTGPADDNLTAVFRVTNAGGTGAALTVSNLTFDGVGRRLGLGFSIEDGATGVFDTAGVRNVIFTPTGVSEGIAIGALLANSLTVTNSTVSGYGRVGIQFDSTNGSVAGSTVTGRGAGTFINNGIEILGNSTVTVTGSTISSNLAFVADPSSPVDDFSTGVLVYADPTDLSLVATGTLIGNTITSNANGIALGTPETVPDGSTLTAQYNNIFGNDFGAVNVSGTGPIQAPSNFWGAPSGPFNATANPNGQGNRVSDSVVFQPFLDRQTPVRSAASVADYLNQITIVGTAISPAADQPDPALQLPVRFTVTFAQPVTGFDASDVVVTTALAGTPVVTVTGSGATYTIAIDGLTGSRGTVDVRVVDRAATTADGFLTQASGTATIPVVRSGLLGEQLTAAGTETGSPIVAVLNQDGSQQRTLTPFTPEQSVGARTALSDFDGDGVFDIAVGSGPGFPALVRVVNGVTGEELFRFEPFQGSNGERFTGGVFVAAGDINGDGRAELVVTPDQGGGPRVLVFNGGTFAQLASFFGITDPDFRGGARAAVGDINGDGFGDVVVAAGFQGGPRVAAFDGQTLFTTGPTKLFNDIFVFPDTLRNGVYVAVGDLNGDGFADLIAGAGPGGGPRVRALSGADLLAGRADNSRVLANFFGGDETNRNGIRVAVKDLDRDNFADLVVGPGIGLPALVTAYTGASLANSTVPTQLWQADPFPGFTGGVFVG